MQLTEKELEALKAIKSFLSEKGKMPSIRELMRVMGYDSPRSSAFLVEKLIEKGVLEKVDKKIQLSAVKEMMNISTVRVPLVGSVSCGSPVLAEENVETYISVSTKIAKNGHKYFLVRANGDSMNMAGINDGDYILVRQQVEAKNGDYVVALVDNESTVKELRREKSFFSLVPRSNNVQHKPIIVNNDLYIQGVVVSTIPKSIIEA